MARENVEMVRLGLEAAGREDWQAAVADLDPEIEIHDYDIPDADVYRGHAGFFKWLAHWSESWESWSMEDVEVLPAGDDRAVALYRLVTKGRASGVELDRRDGVAYEFRGGEIVRIDYHQNQQQALEAVGLPVGLRQ